MNRIVVPALPADATRVVVDAAGSHHLLRVQRVARGAEVVATDAAGARAVCVLVGMEEGLAVLEIRTRALARPTPPRVVLLGIPRGPALDEAVTGAAEAGATEIRLVHAERTPPGQVRPDRLDRVLRAAVTQCGRADSPHLVGPLPLPQALTALPPGRWVATPGLSPNPARPLPTPGEAAALAVGPEGGWSPDEQRALVEAGFVPVDLGPFILRTPTAVVAGLARLWPGGATD